MCTRGKGLISGIKKRFEMSHSSVDQNHVFLKSHNKAMFTHCSVLPSSRGGLITGGAYNRMYFLFPGRWAYNPRGL